MAPIKQDGTLGSLEMIIGDLPDSGQHPNRALEFGPDGMIYLSPGSTCNACNESNRRECCDRLRISPDGKSRIDYCQRASQYHRLRLASRLLASCGDSTTASTFLAMRPQPEELNQLEHGKQYGWPHMYSVLAASIRKALRPGR